jgi:predicted nucleic acid-binding protein
MNLTVDASVFVAAARVEEIHYSASRQFLLQARARDATLLCPALVLPECAAAIARPTGDSALAEELIDLIEGFPGMQLVPLEVHLARQAVHAATNHRLRGADSVYVAVADTFDATLITWDAEMLERGLGAVETVTPSHWLEMLGIPG